MITKHFTLPLLAAAFLMTAPVSAANAETTKDPQALASEGVQNLMRAMELLMLSIPQFEAPFMNENGDIIIRRIRPGAKPDEPETAKPRRNGDKAI